MKYKVKCKQEKQSLHEYHTVSSVILCIFINAKYINLESTILTYFKVCDYKGLPPRSKAALHGDHYHMSQLHKNLLLLNFCITSV